MEGKTTHEIWRILEANLERLENANKVESVVLRQTQVAVSMLMECDPAEVLDCIQESALPTRAIVSWLAYEGGRLGMSEKAGALVNHWTRHNKGPNGVIAPPQPVTS